MIGRRASWVLATVARRDDGDLRAARVGAYRQIDPLLRGPVRRRVERAVARALFETQHGDDERHVHRLAYLRNERAPAPHPDDVDAVCDAFDAIAGMRERSVPAARTATWIALGALTMALLTCAGGAVWWMRPAARLHEQLAPSQDAWIHGGRPVPGSDEARAVFEEALPRYVTALDLYRGARGGEREAAALAQVEGSATRLTQASEAALGADTTSLVRALVDQSRDIVEQNGGAAVDSHIRSVEALNAAIASRGLGYYVDAMVRVELQSGQHRVYLSTFSVERVGFYRSGDERIRALRLRRLDRLNFARAVLGFTREQVADGLVLLDRIMSYLVDLVIPALATDARMPLVDEGSDGPWAGVVETAAGADARQEAVANVGDAISRLGDLLARRRALLDGWRERFSQEGITVQRPRGYALDVDAYALLEDRVSYEEWDELEEIEDGLDDDALRAAYREIERALIESVERHEVQHRLDYASGTMDTIPAALEAHVGPLEVGTGLNVRARRSLAELSAYLSELARGPHLVKTNLALFAGHLFNRRAWGTPESYAALVVFEGLARALGRTPELVVGRSIDRMALAELYLAIRAEPAERLATMAAELWARLFGRALPPLAAER